MMHEQRLNALEDLLLKFKEEGRELTDGYYPTVEELQAIGEEHLKNEYIYLVMYMATNPYEHDPIAHTEAYQKSYKYCRDFIYAVCSEAPLYVSKRTENEKE